MDENFEEKAAKALAIAIIAACLATMGFYLFSQEKPAEYPQAYFRPESLSSQLRDGKTGFALVLENPKAEEAIYSIYYYADDFFLERQAVVLEAQSSTEITKKFEIEELQLEKPIKVKARIEAPKRNFELFYWVES